MDPIPRIHHLQVDIQKDRDKIQYLERQIDGVKSQLSGHQEIFARNFGGLDFGSTIPGTLYASFPVKINVLADYCQRRKIVAELHSVFAFFQEAEITVGTGIDIPITHEFDRYDFVKDIGVARLMRDKQTKDLVAVKYIERGDTIDENLKTEIIEHRSLRHPNIVRFKEVILTPTHLAIVMEYASRGELYDCVSNEGCFPENKARHLFRQLIHGVSYCHSMQVRHRDLKLENILLDESSESLLKICYFGYPKSSVLSSQQNSRVGRPAYVPPEVIINKEYDGKAADVLSCGVTLYEMLVGAYPFKIYSKKPKHFREAIRAISDVRYSFPKDVNISKECRDLISRILVQDPAQRITISAIKKHEWFREKLPVDLVDEEATCDQSEKPTQSLEVIMHIISEAKTPIQTNRT